MNLINMISGRVGAGESSTVIIGGGH